MNIEDVITKWLIEEAFSVSKLEVPIGVKILWGLNVAVMGPAGAKFSIIKPQDKQDRVILVLGTVISPEHKSELDRLKPTERLRVIHSIISKALMTCPECKIAVQPDIVNPASIVINLEIFDDEILKHGKPFFTKTITKLLNTYFTIVSGFNEWFPVLPPQYRERGLETFM